MTSTPESAAAEPVQRPTSPQDGMNGPDLVVVALDGPSGSGKSTVSRMAATRLGYGYLDTGAMYRAATWWCLHEGIDLGDTERVARAVREMPLEIGTDPTAPTVVVGGTDVAEPIRTTEISSVVSRVATNLDVREELRRRQREIIGAVGRTRGGIIAEGRDITTVVAPDADVRILLVASEEARLARRSTELLGSASAEAVEATRDQIVRRDRDDSTVSSFMTAAPGVTTVDTSDLTLQGSVEAVLDEIASAMGRIRD